MDEGFTIKETVDILKKYRLTLNKKLGQNFLADKNILKKIVDSAELKPDDRVLEIGPGIGTLTRELAARAGKLVAVEIDSRLMPVLEETTSCLSNVKLINRDILKIDLRRLWEEVFSPGRVKVVANLPYYITSPVIMKLLEEDFPLESVVVMVQKEVALRMTAAPGTKDYGAITVGVQYYSRPHLIATVPPAVFIPPPKVSSAIVKMDIRKEQVFDVKDEKLLFLLVKKAFGHRRKTLLNALKGISGINDKEYVRRALESAGIDGNRRGESLSVEEFCKLANCMSKIR